jgi:Tfp pilus assembly protein PilO
MTGRDRIIIVVALVAAALAGAWFVGLAPKRKEAAELSAKIATAREQLDSAQQQAAQAREAKAQYGADYAEVAKLGKAVPKSDALPSLLYQLQSAARDARIEFNSLKVSGSGAQAGSSGSESSKSASSGSSSSTSAPATQSASATLPPGASVGSAGFPTMPFTFLFNGSFVDMERFLRDVQQFVRVNGERVDVRGRLLSIDGFTLGAGPGGFPNVKANITATAYLQSPDDANTPAAPASGAAPAPTAMTSEASR